MFRIYNVCTYEHDHRKDFPVGQFQGPAAASSAQRERQGLRTDAHPGRVSCHRSAAASPAATGIEKTAPAAASACGVAPPLNALPSIALQCGFPPSLPL